MARKITRYNGKFEKEEVEMEEAKISKKKEEFPPAKDDEEEDEEEVESKKVKKEAKKSKKEEFPPAKDDDDEDEDEEEVESKKVKKEDKKAKKEEDDEEEDDEEEVEESKKAKKEGRLCMFGTKSEAIFAHDDGELASHDRVLLANPDRGKETVFGDSESKLIETTIGRVIFSEIWPEELGFPNKPMNKNALGEIIANCYKHCGHAATVEALDELKTLGFFEATQSGCSIGIDDMIIPIEKKKEIAREKLRGEVLEQENTGLKQSESDIRLYCTQKVGEMTGELKSASAIIRGAQMANPGKVPDFNYLESPLPVELGFQDSKKR